MCSVFSPLGPEAEGAYTRSGAWPSPSVSLRQAGPQWGQHPPCGRCPSSQTPTLVSAASLSCSGLCLCPPAPHSPATQSRCPPGADDSASYHIPQQPHCGERPTPCPPRNPSVARTYTLRPVSPREGADTAFQDERTRGLPQCLLPCDWDSEGACSDAPAHWVTLGTGGVSWTLVNSCRIATTWRKWILKNASW